MQGNAIDYDKDEVVLQNTIRPELKDCFFSIETCLVYIFKALARFLLLLRIGFKF